MRGARVAAIAGAVAIVLAVAPGAQGVALAAPPALRAYWQWSDGSRADHRTFALSSYGAPDELPTLVVTQRPATPSHVVTLEFADRGAWQVETTARTDSGGVARLSLDPLCRNNQWCDVTFRYRVSIGTLDQELTVTYTSR